MSVVFSSPNPSYRQVLAANIGAATAAGNVAGQWVYAYDTEVLYFVKESANVLSYAEVLSFDGGALAADRRFGTSSIAIGTSSVTVANTSVGANSVILVTPADPIKAANPAGLSIGAIVAGTSFVVTLNNLTTGAAENCTAKIDIFYLIIN